MSPLWPKLAFFVMMAARRRTRSKNEGEPPSPALPASPASTASPSGGRRSGRSNPLAFLGLKPVAGTTEDEGDLEDEEEEEEEQRMDTGIELNNRGLPARKRKKNSLIYGQDDLVSIPVKSPKKRGPKALEDGPKERLAKRASGVAQAIAQTKSAPATPDVKSKAARDLSKVSFADNNKPTPLSTPTSPRKLSSRLAAVTTTTAPPRRIAHKATPNKSPVKGSPMKARRAAAAAAAAAATDDMELTSPEKKSAQNLGVALRNVLKLPKAHKWVCYEFFYSNVDKVLFDGDNDFTVCLRETFPSLKTRTLARVEWCKIRRIMGKPRRCSQNFFAEERAELGRKRSKIRLLQQRKQGDVMNLKDLPEDIPLQLTIGAKVTARLRRPQDGLFTGTVDAYDTSNNTYRITFDRAGLGTHSIPDFEVLASGEAETVPLSTFTAKARPRPVAAPVQQSVMESPMMHSPLKYGSTYSPGMVNDPLLSGSTPRGKVMHLDGQLGGYPVRFLDQLVRLSKCLKRKRKRVDALRKLNAGGEMQKSFGEYITEDFQRRYASTVLDLANLNRELNGHLDNIKEYTQKFSSEAGPTISLPNIIRESCQEDAYNMVNKNNAALSSEEKITGDETKAEYVESPKMLALISSLTALVLQVKNLADGEKNSYELEALQASVTEIKASLHPDNTRRFGDSVEVHMSHIQSGLTRMGNLTAFMKTASPASASEQEAKTSLIKAEVKMEAAS